MKYWMFQSNQVVGPYDREELAEQGGFSAESLVCPEGRKGTQMGDWQRAGVVGELAEVLLRKAKVPAGSGSGYAFDPGASLIPPEPTLRDLAVLGTLQEKVSLLENSLSQLHDELRQRDEEITGLKVQLDEKGQETGQLKEKLTGLESKLEQTEGGLKEEIGKTKEEFAHENELISGLKDQLETVRSDISQSLSKLEENQGLLRDELKSEVSGLKLKTSGAPAFAPEAGAAGLAPEAGAPAFAPEAGGTPASGLAGDLGELPPPPGLAGSMEEVPMPDDLPPPPGMEMPGLEEPTWDPPAMDAGDAPIVTLDPPPDSTGEQEFSMPPLDLGAPPAPDQQEAPYPGQGMDLPITQTGMAPPQPFAAPPGISTPAPGGAAESIPEPDLVDLSAAGAPSTVTPVKKGGFFGKIFKFGLVMALLCGAVFQGYRMGFLKPHLDPLLKQIKPILRPHLKSLGLLPENSPPAATLKEPSAFEEAPVETPPAAEEMSDRPQDAINFAKNWPVGSSGKTLALLLEPTVRSTRRLEPWNAERLGEGRYQVNFYAKPGANPDFQFEVQPGAGEIRGLTANSIAALNGDLPAKAAPAAARPAARKTPRRPRRPRVSARAKAKPRPDLDEDGSLTDPLGEMLLESSLGERKPIAREPQEREEAAAPSPEKKRPARRAPQKPPEPSAEEVDPFSEEGAADSEKSSEELTLDELLLPGVPAR